MAKTNNSMSGLELIKKGARGLMKLKNKYNAAFEAGQNTPKKKKLKKMMDHGYRP